MNLLDKLTLDDLDETQRELAETIGLDAYKALVTAYAGESINIRMPERLTIKVRNEQICREYNGYNIRYLAKKYKLHENSLRRILRDDTPDQFEQLEMNTQQQPSSGTYSTG